MKLNIIPIIFIVSILILTCNKNPTPPEEFDPTQNPFKLTKGEYPDWCPAGDSIAYVRDGDLWIFDITGRKKWRVTKNATQPSFSPDGKQIAFERDKKIYTIDLDTKAERYLADGITPSWSENGKWIAFANKTASYNKSDGSFVHGIPTPDSSLYYYDLEFDRIDTVTVSNYSTMTHHYQKEYMSFFEPEWAEGDSTILFASEFSIWKIRRWGGEAVRYIIDFDDGYYLNKPLDTGWELQPSWSQTNRLIAHLLYTIYDFTGTINKNIIIDQLDTSLGGGIIQNELSHPGWSPNGEKIACYGEDYVWIYDVKELVGKILDGIP